MGKTKKNLKSKTLSLRIYPKAYDFIQEKSEESGNTMADYLLSQISKDSELHQYIESDLERIELELRYEKERYALLKKNMDRDLTSMLQESDDQTIIKLYSDTLDERTKEIFHKVAKERGISLPE